MSVTILTGDCREHMAAMEPESISAIVCDPPYGLEFMGMEWDRLGDVGKTSHAGIPDRDGSTVFGRTRVQYSGSSNVQCRVCGRWKWGHKPGDAGGGGLGCQCEYPDFPNVKAHQARIMQDWHHSWAIEAFRVLKPGGHLLAFGGTRTFHRMTVAIEDAGFEIRDCLSWLYGSGFPKSLDVSKAIDKAAGVDREVVGPNRNRKIGGAGGVSTNHGRGGIAYGPDAATAPATPAAEQWDGWGTALKPAWEPIIVARKPFRGTVAANVLTHGTGAINVDGCRIGTDEAITNHSRSFLASISKGIYGDSSEQETHQTNGQIIGRWPANVVLGCCGNDPHDPDCAVRMLDEQSGYQTDGVHVGRNRNGNEVANQILGARLKDTRDGGYGSGGGASRFFYTACDNSTQDSEIDIIQAWVSADQSLNDQTDATLPARDIYAPTMLAGCDSNTSLSGKNITDRSPQDSKFTTVTKTSKTTESPTSNCVQPLITNDSIADASSATVNGSSPAQSAESSSQSTSIIGTSVNKGGRSTDDADHAISTASLPINSGDELRFKYTAKASSSERHKGLDGRGNIHATVKPVDLMQWLVRLVCPPGGTILDPFMGSGSTCIAADREGFDCIGIEISPEYAEIARRRIVGDCPMFAEVTS